MPSKRHNKVKEFEKPKNQAAPYIGTRDEQAPWQKKLFSKHIETGYRINFSSPRLCLSSLFQLHNETANIWTHLLGVLCFFFLGIYLTFFE